MKRKTIVTRRFTNKPGVALCCALFVALMGCEALQQAAVGEREAPTVTVESPAGLTLEASPTATARPVATPATMAFRTYTDPELGFSLRYGPSWDLEVQDGTSLNDSSGHTITLEKAGYVLSIRAQARPARVGECKGALEQDALSSYWRYSVDGIELWRAKAEDGFVNSFHHSDVAFIDIISPIVLSQAPDDNGSVGAYTCSLEINGKVFSLSYVLPVSVDELKAGQYDAGILVEMDDILISITWGDAVLGGAVAGSGGSGDEPVVPLAEAPAIRFAGWSPDSRWIVYWASSQQDVEQYPPYGFPAGTLHFVNVATGESCGVPGFVAGAEPTTVHWSEQGAAIVVNPDGVYSGRPCQAEPYTALADYTPDERAVVDPALSPDGRYRVVTVLLSSGSGILNFETTITPSDDARPLQRVEWQIDERLGDYGLGGGWISRNQFLLYESLAEGPLLVDVEDGVTPVATQLFGLAAVPSILDEEGYGLRAIPAPGVAPDSFHLLLTGVRMEGNFPAVALYHAESGLVETLPFRSVWWTPFSADGAWLLMDERSYESGYESHAIQIRRVEDIDGEWGLLASGVGAVLWNEEGTEMAFSDGARVRWQSFPGAELIGHWDTGAFQARPVAWSPDGRFLIAEGNVPGEWRYALFLLERPSTP